MLKIYGIAIWITVVLAIPVGAQSPNREHRVDFNRDILPLLSNHCFQCHGPDANQRQAGLRLDTQAGLFDDLGGHAAFAPGRPGDSEAVRRILSDDLDEVMPPPDSNLELSAKDRDLLIAWVDQGARWSEHWAFVPPRRPDLPVVRNQEWAIGPIDRFVLAKMELDGHQPNSRADKPTLIRRVTLDLTGIPPTIDQVDQFLADESDNAYERVVDRLLASPRYGERMAWPWLDAARYADTDGFQGDPTREMWPWRDWLVNALNDNLPFDQFTIEMLAGDLLPNARPDQVIASGFNRNHMVNGEGGRIAEETRTENVFDRTETTATIWLGLTATCARCHDHKFDPLSQREYYQLYAFFNNTSESGAGGQGKAGPTVSYLPPSAAQEIAELDNRLKQIQQKLDDPDSGMDALQLQWESETRATLSNQKQREALVQATHSTWQATPVLTAAGLTTDQLYDHRFGPEPGSEPAAETDSITWTEQPDWVDFQVHPLPATIGVTFLRRQLEAPTERTIELSLGSDDGIQVWLNDKQVLQKKVNRGAAADQEKLVLTLPAGSSQLLIKIVNTGGIGGFYFGGRSETVNGLPLEVANILLLAPSTRTTDQLARLRIHFRRTQPRWQQWDQENEQLKARRMALMTSEAKVMVMDQLPPDKQRTTHVLSRGTYNKPMEPVVAATPGFLPPLNADTVDRLSLARWLVDPANPLTARVTVNRYWQLFFGAGLVSTAEDFGRQGELPTHPELLDWLATELIASDWNVKSIHKQIVMSATYCQSSKSPAPAASSYQLDPENRLLTRGPRYRMPSWMLRDQALAISGLLNESVGGPSVKPYQPEGIWAEATFGQIRYQQDTGPALYRRSLYTFWRRIVGPPIFFDTGKRQTCVVRPSLTNSPLHALTTLNETTFVESARVMADRVRQQIESASEGNSDRLQKREIELAFRMATMRAPTPEESEILETRLEQLRQHFENHVDAAEKFLSIGEHPRNTQWIVTEQAALAAICNLILNLDEVQSKE